MTVACSGGFREHDLYKEVRETVAFANLDDQSWQWALDFAAAVGMLFPPTLTTAESRNDLGDGILPAPHWLVGTE